MKTGELTHRGQAALDNENFEPVKADTFEGLGLPTSLADHLEGKAPPDGLCRKIRAPCIAGQKHMSPVA